LGLSCVHSRVTCGRASGCGGGGRQPGFSFERGADGVERAGAAAARGDGVGTSVPDSGQRQLRPRGQRMHPAADDPVMLDLEPRLLPGLPNRTAASSGLSQPRSCPTGTTAKTSATPPAARYAVMSSTERLSLAGHLEPRRSERSEHAVCYIPANLRWAVSRARRCAAAWGLCSPRGSAMIRQDMPCLRA
jgi:hypothetical protein